MGLAFKAPVFPFHTWLPDALVQGPIGMSVVLAGVKLGTYGFLRFNLPLFPEASVDFVPVISILAIIGIIYGALVAMVQADVKRLVAFSSVSHLGFVMLGLFTFNLCHLNGFWMIHQVFRDELDEVFHLLVPSSFRCRFSPGFLYNKS